MNENEEAEATPLGFVPEVLQTYQSAEAYETDHHHFFGTIRQLMKDVEACNYPLKRSPNSQFWRRSMVRSLFSLIEATIYGFKRLTLRYHAFYEVSMSDAELALLREEKYSLKDNGEAEVVGNSYPPFLPNFKFAFKAFAKVHKSEFVLNSSGITDLKYVFALRNRITHPKRVEELAISDDECKAVMRMWKWFSSEFSRLLNQTHPHSLSVRELSTMTSALTLTQPILALWPDGNAYGFDTRSQFRRFLKLQNKDDADRCMAFIYNRGKQTFLKTYRSKIM